MITDLFGRNQRKGPDTAAAAEELGVSRRTVQRWIAHGLPKRSKQADALRQAWADSPKGRRAAISPAARSSFQGKSAVTAAVSAHVWISNDRRNGQLRSFNHAFTPEEISEIMEASIRDDDEAHQRMEDALGGFGEMNFDSFTWDQR